MAGPALLEILSLQRLQTSAIRWAADMVHGLRVNSINRGDISYVGIRILSLTAASRVVDGGYVCLLEVAMLQCLKPRSRSHTVRGL